MNVVNLPQAHLGDISARLRSLADAIDAGEFGEPNSVVWLIDCGDGRLEMGQLGLMQSPGAETYLILGLGMRKLESILDC